MMRTFHLALLTCLFVLSLPVPHIDARLAATERRLIHMFFKPGSAIVTVTIVDYPSGPKGLITEVSDNGTKKQRSFEVSKLRFNKMLATFISSGADKYAWTPDSQRFDLANYYFFLTGKQCYMVPKNEASQALVSVAMQLRAYEN
jgi:hypothetical protein